MEKGFIINNTDRSKHYLKRKVGPGHRVPLDYAFSLLGKKVPEGEIFLEWLEKNYLPEGFSVVITEKAAEKRLYKETLTAQPMVVGTSPPDLNIIYAKETGVSPHTDVLVETEPHVKNFQYATPNFIDKLTAKEISDLKMKDNPKRILNNINSIHKLRRALSLCKDSSGKKTLTEMIRLRIRKLQIAA